MLVHDAGLDALSDDAPHPGTDTTLKRKGACLRIVQHQQMQRRGHRLASTQAP
jgi:hypothetical protein